MSSIDKLALREAAKKALPAMKRFLMMPNDELFDEALLNVDGDVDAANAFNLLAGPEAMLALLDELEALQSFRTAFSEWHDKTEWVQGDKRFDVIKPWGKHRADVLKLYIDHLKSNLEAAEHTAAVDHEAACSLVEENEELKRKLEAAEQRIAEQREYYEGVIADGSKRIAELEARTVKLPYLPADCDRTEAHFKYQEAIRAAGIQVIEGEQKNG